MPSKLKNISFGGKGKGPDWFNKNGITRNQSMGTHKDVNNTSVSTADNTSVGSANGITRGGAPTGTMSGSSRPQSPDTANVMKAALASRTGATPEQPSNPPPAPTSVNPKTPGAPKYAPESQSSVYQQIKKKLHQRGGFK